jgi:flavin-binding protein dodecin
MAVYKFIALVGTSENSWEERRKRCKTASKTSDIRVAEVEELDMRVENGKVVAYRAKVNISFKIREKAD